MTIVPLAALALSTLLMANDPPPLSRADAETRVKQDLAAKLKVEETEIEVVEAVDREWPDDSLGCPASRSHARAAASDTPRTDPPLGKKGHRGTKTQRLVLSVPPCLCGNFQGWRRMRSSGFEDLSQRTKRPRRSV